MMSAIGASLKCHPARRTAAYGSKGLHILTFFQTGHSPKRLRTALTFLALSVTGTSSAFATSILAKVHIAAHRLNVSVGGKPTYSWGIATARRGYHTPR